MAKEKNLHIETLRGMAILLIVFGHVIGSTPEGAMQIDYPSPWRYFYLCSVFIRLPLITAIAGWVYALKPVNWDKVRLFIKTKFFRLLVPMFIVATIYYLIQIIIPGTNKAENLSQIWRILFFPFTYFWYLYSLFLLMICIAVIDLNKWADSFKGWLACLFIAILLAAVEQTSILDSVPNLFSFKGSLILLPYFIAGVGINRFSAALFRSGWQQVYVVLTIIGIGMLQVEWFYRESDFMTLLNCIKPIVIIPLLILLIRHMPIIRPLVWIGTYSYTIYLYHGFGTSCGRILLSYAGINNQFIVFIFASTVAIFCPFILEKILIKSKPLRFLFLGKK